MIKYKYWRGGRVVEGARLEIVYRGFESLLLRHESSSRLRAFFV